MSGNIKLDLKQFRHVKTDKDSTTLQHKGGHQLVLSHKGLSPESRTQLSALAGIAKDAQDVQDKKGYADGGEVKPKKYKMMGSHSSKEGLEGLASKHFYSNIKVVEHPSGQHEVHNSKGKIEGLRATNKGARWRLEREDLAEGGSIPSMDADDMYFDEGGKIPAPKSGDPQAEVDQKRKLQGVGQSASGGINQPTMDPRSWWAEGGKIEKYCSYCGDGKHDGDCMADGGEVRAAINPKLEESKKTPPKLDYQQILKEKKAMNHAENNKPIVRKKYAEAGPVTSDQPNEEQVQGLMDVGSQPLQDIQSAPAPITADYGSQSASPEPGAGVNAPEAPQGMQSSVPEPAPAAAPVPDAAPQVAAAAPQAAPMPQAPPTPQQAHEEIKQGVKQDLLQDAAHFYQDNVNGHIQPKTYHDLLADKSTLGKIGSLFGMLISGAGSGLAHQQNAMLSAMDNTIKQDLDAQMKRSENVRSLYKLNMENEMNKANINLAGQNSNLIKQQAAQMAYARTFTQMNVKAFHDMKMQADKAIAQYGPNSPEAQKAQMALGMASQYMEKQVAGVQDVAAGQEANVKMMMGMSNPGGGANPDDQVAGRINFLRSTGKPELAHNLQERFVPGIGTSPSTPVPQDVRGKLVDTQNLVDKGTDLIKFAKAHKFDPSWANSAVGKQKAEELINFYNKSLEGGGLTEGRLNWLQQQIKKNPTSVLQDVMGNNKVLQEIVDSAKHRGNNTRSQYQLPLMPEGSAQSGGGHPDGTIIQDAKGNQMIRKNGKWVPK